MTHWKSLATVLLSTTLITGNVLAHELQTAASTTPAGSATVPLYENLGDLTYPITTHHPLAQRYFDQGLRLTYAFNHAEAQRAFREAQRQDPECAMAYWGEAFVLGPNINAPMEDAASNPAVEALSKAKALATKASAREQALIQALGKRYADAPQANRKALDQAYADAMGEVAQRFPDDPDIGVLYVDALMNLSPWDYWEADGKTPKGKIGVAIQTAENVLASIRTTRGPSISTSI